MIYIYIHLYNIPFKTTADHLRAAWEKSSFESSSEKSKFLRLMGGAKDRSSAGGLFRDLGVPILSFKQNSNFDLSQILVVFKNFKIWGEMFGLILEFC